MERKLKIYLDTSVIGGCFDEEFSEWSIKLFEEFKSGNMAAVISDLTTEELDEAPFKVKEKISEIPISNLIQVERNKESDILAKQYLKFI